MNAYTVVGPTKVQPRAFRSLLSAFDSGVIGICISASLVRRRGRAAGGGSHVQK